MGAKIAAREDVPWAAFGAMPDGDAHSVTDFNLSHVHDQHRDLKDCQFNKLVKILQAMFMESWHVCFSLLKTHVDVSVNQDAHRLQDYIVTLKTAESGVKQSKSMLHLDIAQTQENKFSLCLA